MKEISSYLSKELMKFAFTPVHSSELKVIGVGGGGCNAVDFMYNAGIRDVQFINCNTDGQALSKSPVPLKIHLGETLTAGRGAGANPDIGRAAAIESLPDVLNLVRKNTDMVFITAGMGGGTGTGAAPVIAASIKELGILTVGIVTVPFSSEKSERLEHARIGLEKMYESVDALIVIENDKINENYGSLKVSDAFQKANEILAVAAQGIVEIIKIHGEWNVDFNDVKTVMSNSRVALMGTGIARGENRAMESVQNAINSPLLNNSDISGAKRILLNIISGKDEITMHEHQLICNHVQEITSHASDQFIIGVAKDENLEDAVKVTIIATGFKKENFIKVFSLQESQVEPVPEKIAVPVTATEDIPEPENAKKRKPKKNSAIPGLQKLIEFFDEEVK
jgi:cell division protein FtsZ